MEEVGRRLRHTFKHLLGELLPGHLLKSVIVLFLLPNSAGLARTYGLTARRTCSMAWIDNHIVVIFHDLVPERVVEESS